MKLTLTTNQINAIKMVIANKENRLDIDITDAEVFEYLSDMESADQLASMKVNFSNRKAAEQYDMNYAEISWVEPRNRVQIATDLINSIVNPQGWLAFC